MTFQVMSPHFMKRQREKVHIPFLKGREMATHKVLVWPAPIHSRGGAHQPLMYELVHSHTPVIYNTS